MVDFLPNISAHFRERFLDTHLDYLHSISYIIQKMYFEKDEPPPVVMLNEILKQRPKIRKKKKDSPFETSEFRNLRNCWYNECALNYPFDNLDERMKFASWKIMQCYYAVFSAIASLVCCHHEEQYDISKTVNLYTNEFLCGKRKAFTLPPLNLFVNQQNKIPSDEKDLITWKWGRNNCVPKIENFLVEVQKRNRPTAIPHYLRTLREYFTYQDMYLLFRLYGASPKDKLDDALCKITFAYCLQTEFYLINLYGWDAVERQFAVFSSELSNSLHIKSSTLNSRFKIYKSMSF